MAGRPGSVVELPELSLELLTLGARLVEATISWQEWCHRKVEQFELLEGARGRRRVSVDCTPRSVTWTQPGTNVEVGLVPLTYLSKETLRSFDLRDGSGGAIAVLDSETNGLLSAAAIASLVAIEMGSAAAAEYWPDMLALTTATPAIAEPRAERLIANLDVSVIATTMIRDLARSFLLIAALTPSALEQRQIIKFSYHWDVDQFPKPRPLVALAAGLGFTTSNVRVKLSGLDTARSFHFECIAPAGILCDQLTLPKDASGQIPADQLRTSVGHVHGRFGWGESQGSPSARVRFIIDPRALLIRVLWSSLAVSALFWSVLVVPGLTQVLRGAVEPTLSVIIFLVAVIVVLGSRGRESDLVAKHLWVLRITAYVLAFQLMWVGVLFVVMAPDQLIASTWVLFAVVSGLIFATLSSAWIQLKISGER